jgi:hypothetical protein
MKQYTTAVLVAVIVALIFASCTAQVSNPTAIPTFITNEVVSGGPTTWTLAHTPVEGTVQLFSGSAAIWPGGGADYTISVAIITTNSPVTIGTLHASYRY